MAFLRPTSDDLDGSWTTEAGGTDLFSAVDEATSSDVDYIRSGANPTADICRVALSDPTGGVDSAQAVTVRYRYRKQGSGVMNLTARLKQGTTAIATWQHENITTSFVTAAQTLTTQQKAAITDWNALLLEFEANLQAASLTAPVYLGIAHTGNNSVVAGTGLALAHPAYSAGDLVICFLLNDNNAAVVYDQTFTAPNGETVTMEVQNHTSGIGSNEDQLLTIGWFIATADQAAGSAITCGWSGISDNYECGALVIDAGTFNTTTPIANVTLTQGLFTNSDPAVSGAFTAASADGMVLFIANQAYDVWGDAVPSDWTQLVENDRGALVLEVYQRNALTSASEAVAAATFDTTINNAFVGATFLVMPNGS